MSDIIFDERIAQILEIARTSKYHSLEEFADALNVSTRSVRNYLKQLNDDLVGIASIINERGRGYRLDIIDKQAFESLLEKNRIKDDTLNSQKGRIAFIIDRLMNSEETYTLDDLASEMHIGRTTLVNEIKKAAVSLETYSLTIQGKPNRGMELKGKELDLRFYILDNLYDVLYGDYPLDTDIIEAIEMISNKHNLESTTQARLMEFIIIMLDRILKDHPINEVDEKHKKLLGTMDYQIALEIVQKIENQLPIKIPQAEILFITLPIAGRRTPTNNRTLADIAITQDVQKLLEQIIEHVGFKKEIIYENESFFKDLQYHLTFMLNRLIFGLRLKNPLLADVKEKYFVAYKMAEIAGQVVENRYGLKVPEDELGYLAFYFGVFIGQSDLKEKRFRRAAVVCGTGRGTAKLVAIQLQRVLNQNTEIDLFSEKEATKVILDKYDLVFSTVKLSFETSAPFIMINEIFDERNVSREIEKVTYMKKLKIHNANDYQSMITHLVTKEKFFLLDSTKGYQENVLEMIEYLVEDGHLDTGFKERLKEREEQGSMVFDRYIAFPHTFNNRSESIELAIGVFPENVVADGKEVKLVFLLGLPERQNDHNENLIVKIYDEIIRIANNQQIIDQLTNVSTYEQFMRVIEQSSN
ncbi:BglG family transcription antiterminator [Metabacillus niabensis]|uniref:Lichenan operon transcriptional antiterminator n=1 Tax=Metabacillus niabensis TaxID=324854 RepID=A0ABT9YVN6_9BACI|nr:PRD domain-containing protein [Metabacillus niabensis]MDQ0224056.1 lichenan operon transcriptional antiterminator [Metabacillus niabensis]